MRVVGLAEDICALGNRVSVCEAGLWEGMAAGADDGRGRGGLEGNEPSTCDLFGVARAEVEKIGHGAVESGELDGLVRWAVGPHADGVVGCEMDGVEVLEGGHADCRGGVLRFVERVSWLFGELGVGEDGRGRT